MVILDYALRHPIMTIITLVLVFFGTLCLGVLIGNTVATRILVRMGFSVTTGYPNKDYRIYHRINEDVLGWLKVPGACYAPIMRYAGGFYRKHTVLRRPSFTGELSYNQDVWDVLLNSIALPSDNELGDLAIIDGSTEIRTNSFRTVQFTNLRRFIEKDFTDQNVTVTLCEKNKTRYFRFLFAVEAGIENEHKIRFTSRNDFIESLRKRAYRDSGRSSNKPIIILRGNSRIDSLIVFLVEVGASNE